MYKHQNPRDCYTKIQSAVIKKAADVIPWDSVLNLSLFSFHVKFLNLLLPLASRGQ